MQLIAIGFEIVLVHRIGFFQFSLLKLEELGFFWRCPCSKAIGQTLSSGQRLCHSAKPFCRNISKYRTHQLSCEEYPRPGKDTMNCLFLLISLHLIGFFIAALGSFFFWHSFLWVWRSGCWTYWLSNSSNDLLRCKSWNVGLLSLFRRKFSVDYGLAEKLMDMVTVQTLRIGSIPQIQKFLRREVRDYKCTQVLEWMREWRHEFY